MSIKEHYKQRLMNEMARRPLTSAQVGQKARKERNNLKNLQIRASAVNITPEKKAELEAKIKLAQHGVDLYGSVSRGNKMNLKEHHEQRLQEAPKVPTAALAAWALGLPTAALLGAVGPKRDLRTLHHIAADVADKSGEYAYDQLQQTAAGNPPAPGATETVTTKPRRRETTKEIINKRWRNEMNLKEHYKQRLLLEISPAYRMQTTIDPSTLARAMRNRIQPPDVKTPRGAQMAVLSIQHDSDTANALIRRLNAAKARSEQERLASGGMSAADAAEQGWGGSLPSVGRSITTTDPHMLDLLNKTRQDDQVRRNIPRLAGRRGAPGSGTPTLDDSHLAGKAAERAFHIASQEHVARLRRMIDEPFDAHERRAGFIGLARHSAAIERGRTTGVWRAEWMRPVNKRKKGDDGFDGFDDYNDRGRPPKGPKPKNPESPHNDVNDVSGFKSNEFHNIWKNKGKK